MSDPSKYPAQLPAEQQAIRANSFHPTGTLVELRKEEVEQSIPERFEKIVRMYPDYLAVKTRNHALTYDEVNKAANRMAHAILSRRGEGQEAVALLLEYDVSVIAALLGVLKAGKFYISLDPSFPHARLTSILEETQVSLIITSNANLPLAYELADHRLQLLNVDECDSNLLDNLGLAISPDSLVQILYTSGSTGQPKGIVQSHRSEFRRDITQIERYHLCEEDRMIFIRSTVRVFPFPLLCGAAFFPWSVKEQGMGALADWIIQEGVTVYDSVPSVFRQFVNSITQNEKFPKLRLINVIGETLYNSDIELYKKRFSANCIFINTLGSSETGPFRHYVVDKNTHISGHTVPVGYAIQDAEVLLLDDDGKQVGINCIGEIVVKTPYMSSGYWRRPELTRAAFISDPAGSGGHIYLTGDVGRMMPDGCLVHLGRKDFQVKIRGNRVEVAETEAVLLEHTGIKEAVVVTREDHPGDKRLVAYIVPRGKPGPSVSELRAFLKEKLPAYMVPSAFMMLDAFPLLEIGKVDRKGFPAPDNSRPELGTPFVAPRTPSEEELAKIWVEVLGIDQVGIHDNFFELGGHSLAATQVVSRVMKKFHFDIPLQSLFQSPTLAEMSAVITEHQGKKLGEKEMERILTELESLTDAQAQRILSSECERGRGKD